MLLGVSEKLENSIPPALPASEASQKRKTFENENDKPARNAPRSEED